MIRFIYWGQNIETGEEITFYSEVLYSIGEVEEIDNQQILILDLAAAQEISCEELLLQREDEYFYGGLY